MGSKHSDRNQQATIVVFPYVIHDQSNHLERSRRRHGSFFYPRFG